MQSLATSAIAPVLGQHVPIRGPARLLYRSYSRTNHGGDYSARKMKTRLGDEFNVDPRSFLEWQLWAFGTYEGHFAELFRNLIRPGDRCIDVGANIGIHSIRLAKLVGARGEVIAFEPDEGLARRANDNIRLNNLTNIRIIQAAAAERGGASMQLFRPDTHDSNKGRASLLHHSYLTGSTAAVPTSAIDEVSQCPLALIKIDVEGYEAAVISGAKSTIEDCFPSIIFEHAPDLLCEQFGSPFDWLRERNYRLFRISKKRHLINGKAAPRLERLHSLPEEDANILAISAAMVPRVSELFSPKTGDTTATRRAIP